MKEKAGVIIHCKDIVHHTNEVTYMYNLLYMKDKAAKPSTNPKSAKGNELHSVACIYTCIYYY